MNVRNINSIGFYAKDPIDKRRILPKETQENIALLLQKMNQSCVYTQNKAETAWDSNILTSLQLKGKDVRFYDQRYLVAPIEPNPDRDAMCSFEFGKTILKINGKNGEIVGYHRGIFESWRYLYAKINSTADKMLKSFDNPEVVTQKFLKICGFTKKGFEILFNKK